MSSRVVNLTYSQSNELITSSPNLKILDVRSSSEYRDGHIPGAVNISYEDLEFEIDDLVPEKDNPILIYCRTGRRSHLAIETLKELDYEKIYHIYEGLSDWPYKLNK